LLLAHLAQITLRGALIKPVASRVANTWCIGMTHQQDVLPIGQVIQQPSAGGLSARH
jgi:hypothetical protein